MSAYRATSAQRSKIYALQRQLSLDPQTITLLHKPTIEKAGMRFEGWNGETVAGFVTQLSVHQASQYIDALQAQVGEP